MTATATGSTDTSSYPAPTVSVARMFYDRVAATPRAEAFRFPAGTGWASLTWAQTAETVKTMAAGLLALGIQPEERVAIASATRIEWLYADLAIMCAGAATTAVYPSTGAEDAAFIISDSGTRLVFAEDQAQIAKLRAQRDHLPDVIRVVTFDGQADGEWVLSLADLQALGAKHLAGHPAAVDEAVAAVGPEHLATLIYTSGTTGRPKGVELPHRCWTYVGAGAEALGVVSAGDLQYLWLPLSHAFGKMLEAVQLQIGFPTAVDGRMDKIVENLAVVRPTFMAGPPRIFEKIHAKVVQTAQEEGGIKFKVFTRAFGVGNQVSRARIQGRKPGLAVQAQHALADRLVLSKVRQALGGRIRFLLSGSAALSKDIATWFHAAGPGSRPAPGSASPPRICGRPRTACAGISTRSPARPATGCRASPRPAPPTWCSCALASPLPATRQRRCCCPRTAARPSSWSDRPRWLAPGACSPCRRVAAR